MIGTDDEQHYFDCHEALSYAGKSAVAGQYTARAQ
jgi:hypothetical protein